MKKLLSLVLVLALVLGSFAFATPADVVGTNYATAVDRLMSLNLLTGYPDGTFKPAATITRAEFAAVVVRALGLESAAAVNSPTKFADVPASHWASGYISVASGLGVINGYTTGNFGPADPVTYEQAIAMVVRALGYEPSVAKKGGYPAGYLIVASELDILDGVIGTVGTPAPRGLVANLVDNALQVDLMEQVVFGTEIEYQVVNKTLLTSRLGLTEGEFTVDSVDTDDNELVLDGDTYKAAAGVKVDSNLENLDVTAWYKDSSDTVYVLAIDSKVMFDYIDEDNHDADEITLYNADKTYDVAGTATFRLDDASVAITNAGYDDAYGKFIFDRDGDISYVDAITGFVSAGVVTSATDTTLKYTNMASNTGAAVTLVDMDDADFGWVTVDANLATYADIKAGMFIQYFIDANDNYYFFANSKPVEGKFESVRGDLARVTIGGTAYISNTALRYSTDKLDNIATIGAAADLEDFEDAAVIAYRDAYFDVVLLSGDVEETTSSFYAILKSANTFTAQVKVDAIVDGDLELVTYAYDEDELTAPMLATVADYAAANYDGVVGYDDVFEFVVDEDNVVIEINAITYTAAIEMESVNTTANSFKSGATNYFPKTTAAIFDLTDALGDANVSDVEVLTWADVVASDIDAGDTVTVRVDSANTKPELIVVIDNDDVLGTSTEDYILAYAATAPTLSAGKYKGTVKTMDGDLAVVVDDAASKINGWTTSKDVLVLQKQSNGEYAVIDRAAGNNFATDGALAAITTNTDWAVVDGVVVADVDGEFVTIGATTYKVAENALVYRSTYPEDTTITASDVSAMVAGDHASFVHEDGVIYLLFYYRP